MEIYEDPHESCVTADEAQQLFSNVSINIPGVKEKNAYDLLMNTIQKDLQGVSIQDLKNSVSEYIDENASNKKRR